MNKLIRTGRLVGLGALLLILLCVYFAFLYKLQIIEGDAYYEESRNTIATNQTVTAARGNILDRYGRSLVTNSPCYNITINEQEMFYEDNDPNALILELTKLATECGDSYNDTLHITMSPPFEYTQMTASQQNMFNYYLVGKNLADNISAVELLSYMRSRYDISNSYTAAETRIIAGVRYEINARYSEGYVGPSYIFVEDASMELVTALLENNIRGVNVETSYVREYNTQYAAHILGNTGQIDSTEVEKYTALGYSMDALVGKGGAEYAFEEYLHGVDGLATITTSANGTVTNTIYTVEPQPGNNVYLSIDIVLQEATERALADGIAELAEAAIAEAIEDGEEPPDDPNELINAGAAVVVDVNTGEPLAIASYPTYNLSTFNEDFEEILADTRNPMYNRALMGVYAPGSTFKPCTAVAALTEGIANTETIINCEGVFRKYSDVGYSPVCWIWGTYGLTHGNDNVTQAVRDSCNIFFYTVGDELGITKLDEYAAAFGLGQSTGIELGESIGNMANPENHEALQGQEWYNGDTVQAAIGQSDSLFTPIQLAEYCATIANSGTRHSASILKMVRSYDYARTVFNREAEVLSTVTSPDYNWSAVQEGMYLVSTHPNGSAYLTFYNYPVGVASKTGTAQRGEGVSNNGVFICYAPYDDPQVAVAIVVERAGAGASLAPIARDILDGYFATQGALETNDNEFELLK